jgi:energy-coupling factor transporter ATP-binding protein EcfA2
MGKLDDAALRGIGLTIGSGELVAIVGPSGGGSTTVLNMISRIDRPSAGTVMVAGRRIDAEDKWYCAPNEPASGSLPATRRVARRGNSAQTSHGITSAARSGGRPASEACFSSPQSWQLRYHPGLTVLISKYRWGKRPNTQRRKRYTGREDIERGSPPGGRRGWCPPSG